MPLPPTNYSYGNIDEDPNKNIPSEKNPLPWQKYFDPSNSKQIRDELAATRSNMDAPAKAREGGIAIGEGMGGSASPMSAALASHANAGATQDTYGRQKQAEFDKPMQTAKELSREGGWLATEQQIKLKNWQEQYQYQLQRKQLFDAKKQADAKASADVWGKILGLAGFVVSVGATIFTGGAAAPSLIGGGAGLAKAFAPSEDPTGASAQSSSWEPPKFGPEH